MLSRASRAASQKPLAASANVHASARPASGPSRAHTNRWCTASAAAVRARPTSAGTVTVVAASARTALAAAAPTEAGGVDEEARAETVIHN